MKNTVIFIVILVLVVGALYFMNRTNDQEVNFLEEEDQITIAGEVFDVTRSARVISIIRAKSPLSSLFEIGVVDETQYYNSRGEELVFEDIKKDGFLVALGRGDEESMIPERILFIEEGEESLFSEIGNISINAPGNVSDIPYLVYEKPGFPANSVSLSFAAWSICNLNQEDKSCTKIKNNPELFSGERVQIYGKREGGAVYVLYAKIISNNNEDIE